MKEPNGLPHFPVAVQICMVWQVGDKAFAGWPNRVSLHQDCPGVWGQKPCRQFYQCGFPAPVWPKKPHNMAAPNLEVNAQKGWGARICFGQAFTFQYHFHHPLPVPRQWLFQAGKWSLPSGTQVFAWFLKTLLRLLLQAQILIGQS